MPELQSSPFDLLAEEYDAVWTDHAIGFHQRQAVWRHIDPLFQAGQSVLDLGCGTGVDAAHLKRRGVHVTGVDSSHRMIERARERGVDAFVHDIDKLSCLHLKVDGLISNFGALNCVASIGRVAAEIGRLVHRGGYVALCLMGRSCAWELLHYLRRGQPGKAIRRWSGISDSTLGVRVTYFSAKQILRAFQDEFRLVRRCGIGLFVPPSYVDGLSASAIARLALLDQDLAHLPLLRSMSDHSLYVLQRI